MWKRLDKNLWTTGNRSYRRVNVDGKIIAELVSWRINRCIICQRFLGKRQLKYCSRCVKNQQLRYEREWKERNRERVREHYRRYYNEHRDERNDYVRKYKIAMRIYAREDLLETGV